MGAFLENQMFLFVDDTEPILPIFRPPEYNDTGKIVELTDVGCDTEIISPIHFQRGAHDWRRIGTKKFRSNRRIAKSHNEKPKNFARTVMTLDNFEDRNRNYIGERMQQNDIDYDDVYITDLGYDFCVEDYYNDFQLPNNHSTVEYKNGYTQFVNPRNMIRRSRNEHLPRNTRYNYSKNLKSPFIQNSRVHQRENTSPRWFADSADIDERNFRDVRNTDVRSRRLPSNKRKNRPEILSTDENFNCEAEFENAYNMTERRERDIFSNTADSIALSKNNFWDFVSLENEVNCEESTFIDPAKAKNHDGLQRMAPQRRSHKFDSQQKRMDIVNSEAEEESKEMQQGKSQENVSSKSPARNARYRNSGSDAMTEKPKILRSNPLTGNSLQVRSEGASTDGRISNVFSTGKKSTNMRPRSAYEGKKTNINSPTAERKEEIVTATSTQTSVEDHLYRDKLTNKLFNKSPNAMSRSLKTFNRVVDSKNNKRIYVTNEKNNMNSHPGSCKKNKNDRCDVAVSPLTSEKEITRNEKTFSLRMNSASPCIKVENQQKKKNFSSRLPVRTWKRVRTKGPATLHFERNIMNANVNEKLQQVNIETVNLNNHPERVEDDEACEEIVDHAAIDRNSIKRNIRFETRPFSADEPRLSTFSNSKEIKSLNTPKGTHEPKGKKLNVQ